MEYTNSEILELFAECKALLKGHFLLTSGKHSDRYFEKIKLIENPEVLNKIVDKLVMLIKLKNLDFEYVVSPAFGAIAIGFLVALKLNKKFAFTQREGEQMVLRSGFSEIYGKKAIVVEDIVTTGGSIMEVSDCLVKSSVEIVAFFVLLDRSNKEVKINGKEIFSLAKVDATLYEPDNCPLCKQKISVIKPGASNKFKK